MPEDVEIESLATLADDQMFEAIAEGTQLLWDNLNRLEKAAGQLSDAGDYASAAVLGHFATEEAAKILILLDVVRCPPTEQEARKQTLGRWTSHLWKGIYAEACAWSPADFNEVRQHVERDLEWYHLDGLYGIDWIFPNQIATSRERLIYVDYVRDLTHEPQDAIKWWTSPNIDRLAHLASPCVRTVQALCNSGVTTVHGLGAIAQIWRQVTPKPDFDWGDLRTCILVTIERLGEKGLDTGSWANGSRPLDVFNWPFPLWSLQPKSASRKATLERLREERRDEIKRIAEIEEQRDPPPAISEEQILVLHQAYLKRKAAEDRRMAEIANRKRGRFASVLSPQDVAFVYDVDAPEYHHLRDLWRDLKRDEKIALLALAWFTRDTVADWPQTYESAKSRFDGVEEHYHLGCAHEWLEGYRRWRGEQTRPWRLPAR